MKLFPILTSSDLELRWWSGYFWIRNWFCAIVSSQRLDRVWNLECLFVLYPIFFSVVLNWVEFCLISFSWYFVFYLCVLGTVVSATLFLKSLDRRLFFCHAFLLKCRWVLACRVGIKAIHIAVYRVNCFYVRHFCWLFWLSVLAPHTKWNLVISVLFF